MSITVNLRYKGKNGAAIAFAKEMYQMIIYLITMLNL